MAVMIINLALKRVTLLLYVHLSLNVLSTIIENVAVTYFAVLLILIRPSTTLITGIYFTSCMPCFQVWICQICYQA